MNYLAEAQSAEASGYFDELNDLYNTIEGGDCRACVRCCSESVNVSYLEFLNIIRYIDAEQVSVPVRKVVQYHVLEWVKPMKCPFLMSDRRCSIYPVRPLPCRLFGNVYEEDYQRNMAKILRQNAEVARALYATEGLLLPKRVTKKQIQFCNDYTPKKRWHQAAVADFYDRLIQLDARITFRLGLKGHRHNEHLVSWMMRYLTASDDACLTFAEDVRYEALRMVNLRSSAESASHSDASLR
ncbi:YkgJ family cysteine cluster protein [Fusibacter sp. JL298sf-3]